eukprot:2936280-Lingulodinium_polyedra.AAC.1
MGAEVSNRASLLDGELAQLRKGVLSDKAVPLQCKRLTAAPYLWSRLLYLTGTWPEVPAATFSR